MTALLLSLLLGCAKTPEFATPPTVTHHPEAFGGQAMSNEMRLPRAALAHLTSGQPLAFSLTSEGAVLRLDESGLLGAVGIFRGDTLLTDDVESLIDGWFTEDSSKVTLLRHGEERHVVLSWEGPPTPPPSEPLTNLGHRTGLALLSPEGSRISRGILAHLPASTAVPVRVDGRIAGYRLTGPIAVAMGLTEIYRVDGNDMNSDEALYTAIGRWFTADQTLLENPGGERLIRWEGAATTPPAMWLLPIEIDADEAAARAEFHPTADGYSIGRDALREVQRAQPSMASMRDADAPGILLFDLLPKKVLGMLQVSPFTVVVRINDTNVRYEDPGHAAFRRAKQIVLTEPQVTLHLDDGRSVHLQISGPALDLQGEWWAPPVGPADPPPGVTTEPVSATEYVVRTDRLTLRRLIAESVHCSLLRPDFPPGCSRHTYWTALGLPTMGIVELNGAPVQDAWAVEQWFASLCTSNEASIGAHGEYQGDQRVRFEITGPPVPCP